MNFSQSYSLLQSWMMDLRRFWEVYNWWLIYLDIASTDSFKPSQVFYTSYQFLSPMRDWKEKIFWELVQNYLIVYYVKYPFWKSYNFFSLNGWMKALKIQENFFLQFEKAYMHDAIILSIYQLKNAYDFYSSSILSLNFSLSWKVEYFWNTELMYQFENYFIDLMCLRAQTGIFLVLSSAIHCWQRKGKLMEVVFLCLGSKQLTLIN